MARALPRWDSSNPTTYRYDWKNYDPQDYAKFKEARQAADQRRQDKAERDLAKTMKDVGQSIKDKIKEELGDAVKPGDVLTIDKPSTCFKSVSWEATGEEDDDGEIEGVATGIFHRGGALVYDYQMTLSDFLDWSADESTGSYFNENVR